ncbi:type I glutamate--ammonia ligase [Corynebacterium sp. NML98-0116]|uniref:Glutamine synthetase n=2 Tax=Corynebacterium TaxID=1716 RepID=A0ABD4TUC7_9CORY|nr:MULTISPECIES: type I glutamate--ammonia ligase [Corynebacterium]AOX06626.1 type I glutamate--ammonia ligase [Corynebacterium sp. NML98-0116]MCO6395392.1 type I glutamate--ammonia ligase [Corynebacterium lipophilum]MCQ4607537.1 type I glutamate--ammonia ligase [Corynebacterium pseudogenitalium]MCQ4608826.1 type I glutamate--ammonia ligase [Corynebacterium sp. CCUG 61414]MCQ4611834.1 type I glutamate--ammonia ligase [Corynebacterium sp. CCUG 51687]
MDTQQENVLRMVEQRDIAFIRLWFTDIFGSLKTVMMSPAELEAAFDEGVGFDGSSIEGFSRISESDTLLRPDPSTFQPLPFDEGTGLQTARMFCDITMPDGDPLYADPRQVLRRQMTHARELGFEFNASPEIEYYVLKQNMPGEDPVPADKGGYFDQAKRNEAPKLRRQAIAALEYMGIVTEFSHHEASAGQQEIDLRHTDALTMADNVVTFRYIVKTVAEANGVHATFMPKPFADMDGSAMHTHFSLWEGETNAFHDPDDEISLSKTGRQFIAGIIEHANEISAVTNQWVNSYKRLQFGSEAPTAATWGVSNRSAMVRVPTYRLHKADSRRIEVRSLDSACNPYLAYAAVLAAGLRGIEGEYELDEPSRDDVFALTRRERRAMGYRDLPNSLDQALRHLERSEFMAEVLGEQVFEFFLRSKWDEYHAYTSQITPWEIESGIDL